VSRRDQIKLSEAELLELLEGERVAIVSSLGPRGWPHSMPMWFVPRGGEVWIWTYAKSQKVRNLERDGRATLQLEAGRDVYGQLRGAMLECDVAIERDPARVGEFGMRLMARYTGAELSPEARAGVLQQAPKRVVLRFTPTRIVSWDHRKLGGTY